MAETRFVAKALVFDKDGRFLRLTRSDSHPALAGLYDLPGGGVEIGEEPGSAVIREIFEETSLVVQPEQTSILYAVTLFLDNKSFPTLLYKVQLYETTPSVALSYEHKDFSWESVDQIAEIEPHIAPTYRQALDYLRQHELL
jgi:8-oxo-dGTP diphosphatase